MYKPETIRKVIENMNRKLEELEVVPVGNIKMCISRGNKKIGLVMNVSLPPILSCPNCAGCSKLCYDVKACLQYPNTVISARCRNLSILRRDRDRYFEEIDKAMTRRRKNKFFRWHVAGDIIDPDYFSRMIEIARRHPDFTIWTYTKSYQIVNEWCAAHGRDAIPANFTIMFSEWRGMRMNNPYNFPEFKVVFKGETPPRGFYCPGNCDVCKAAGRGCITGETVYCHEH